MDEWGKGRGKGRMTRLEAGRGQDLAHYELGGRDQVNVPTIREDVVACFGGNLAPAGW